MGSKHIRWRIDRKKSYLNATDIRWRIGYKTCFEKLVVQQDFSLRTVGMPAYEDDPRAEGFHLFRKYGEMLSD